MSLKVLIGSAEEIQDFLDNGQVASLYTIATVVNSKTFTTSATPTALASGDSITYAGQRLVTQSVIGSTITLTDEPNEALAASETITKYNPDYTYCRDATANPLAIVLDKKTGGRTGTSIATQELTFVKIDSPLTIAGTFQHMHQFVPPGAGLRVSIYDTVDDSTPIFSGTIANVARVVEGADDNDTLASSYVVEVRGHAWEADAVGIEEPPKVNVNAGEFLQYLMEKYTNLSVGEIDTTNSPTIDYIRLSNYRRFGSVGLDLAALWPGSEFFVGNDHTGGKVYFRQKPTEYAPFTLNESLLRELGPKRTRLFTDSSNVYNVVRYPFYKEQRREPDFFVQDTVADDAFLKTSVTLNGQPTQVEEAILVVDDFNDAQLSDLFLEDDINNPSPFGGFNQADGFLVEGSVNDVNGLHMLSTTQTNAPPNPSSDWLFNDRSGSTIEDNKNLYDLTASGTYLWGEQYLNVDGSGLNGFAAANGGYGSLGANSFTIALWVSFNAVSSNRSFLAIGSGSNVSEAGDNALIIDYRSAPGFRASVSNDSSLSRTTEIGGTLVAGVKYLMLVKYTRAGGASNNTIEMRLTTDGITWYSNSNSSAVLMQQDATFELRNVVSLTTGIDANYHRMMIFNGTVTTTGQDDDIWAWGSEGPAIVSDVVIGDIGRQTDPGEIEPFTGKERQMLYIPEFVVSQVGDCILGGIIDQTSLETTIETGSTATVLQVVSSTGFVAGDRVTINNQKRYVSSVGAGTVTLTEALDFGIAPSPGDTLEHHRLAKSRIKFGVIFKEDGSIKYIKSGVESAFSTPRTYTTATYSLRVFMKCFETTIASGISSTGCTLTSATNFTTGDVVEIFTSGDRSDPEIRVISKSGSAITYAATNVNPSVGYRVRTKPKIVVQIKGGSYGDITGRDWTEIHTEANTWQTATTEPDEYGIALCVNASLAGSLFYAQLKNPIPVTANVGARYLHIGTQEIESSEPDVDCILRKIGNHYQLDFFPDTKSLWGSGDTLELRYVERFRHDLVKFDSDSVRSTAKNRGFTLTGAETEAEIIRKGGRSLDTIELLPGTQTVLEASQSARSLLNAVKDAEVTFEMVSDSVEYPSIKPGQLVLSEIPGVQDIEVSIVELVENPGASHPTLGTVFNVKVIAGKINRLDEVLLQRQIKNNNRLVLDDGYNDDTFSRIRESSLDENVTVTDAFSVSGCTAPTKVMRTAGGYTLMECLKIV